MKEYKNIIVLIFVLVVTIVGCAYALQWHSVYKANLLNTPIISNYIHELKSDEFNNYVSDNPYAIIYFGVASDTNCRAFESKFKDYILDNNLKESIVYVNVNNIVGTNFANDFDRIYNTDNLRKKNRHLTEVPALAIYLHTTLIDFVSSKDLTIDKVKALLSKYSFVGE